MVACIIILVLMVMQLTINLVKHNELREGIAATYNFWVALISTIIDLVLYYFAGMFNCFTN